MNVVAHWQALPLHGRVLVEASAGTGKTWTLGVLYLRLLLEAGHTPAQILVGTFTDAAAQELRERLRARLRWALQTLAGGTADDDPASDWLRAQAQREPQCALRLALAIDALDAAPIGTLHGLCKRILGEHALDSGETLRRGELVSERGLRARLVDDLWRELAQSPRELDPGEQRLLGEGRAALLRALTALDDANLELRLAPPPDPVLCAALREPERATALRALADREALFVRRNGALPGELRRLAAAIDATAIDDPGFDPAALKLKLLLEATAGAGPVLDQLRPGMAAALLDDPDYAFARAAARLLQALPRRQREQALHARLQALQARRAQYRRRHEVLTFTDLIEGVHAAVTRDPALAARLQAQWPVALVDEFQDTDARQYAIFDRMYRHDDGEPRGLLMLIGDPKQAIYRFRGGDIHTYQRAAGACAARLDLDTNHRASADYVTALNALYAAAGDGFRIAPGPGWFGYHPVAASRRRADTPYRIGGQPCTWPLRIHALDLDAVPARAEDRRARALESCAETIAEALAGGGHRFGDAVLQASDIAVLLPTNEQVLDLRHRLRRRGVPCTGAGRGNVFASEWARSLQIVLWAVLHPQDDGALRAALLTPLFGFDLAGLRALQADAAGWGAQVDQFATLRRRWERAGLLAMLAPLVDAAAGRLLADPERGERALTDLRHLGELLAAADAGAASPEATWAWLAAQRADPDDDAGEEQSLRVESDRARVQLLTLHASKGLEFRWVLLPLMWDQDGRDDAFPVVFDGVRQRRMLLLGDPDRAAARTEAAVEDQRERLRLLYVALTRAIYRCDVWAPHPSRPANARTRAPLGDPQRSALDRLLEPLFAARAAGAAMPAAIDWREGWPQGEHRCAVAMIDLAGEPAVAALGGSRPLQALLSYSALTHGRRGEAGRAGDEIDADAPDAFDEDGEHPELRLWDRWRGPRLGDAMHQILERRRPGLPLSAQLDLVVQGVRAQALDPALQATPWRERLAARLDACLQADLGDGLRLAALPAHDLRCEMDFRFHLAGSSLAALRAACERYGDAELLPPQVGAHRVNGLFSGKIDLVFAHAGRVHILDYKSNRLGLRLADYRPQALHRAMGHSGYRFQALLYVVAVQRYLRQRRPDYQPARDLGEAWYLYLRAVGLAPEVGIWRCRFPQALVDAVDAVFADGAPA